MASPPLAIVAKAAAGDITHPGSVGSTAMSRRLWVVDDAGGGVRLDKYLADPSRLGSRGRALDALVRGRIFLNDDEATAADASRPLTSGDRLGYWEDRPGSGRRRPPRAARAGELTIVYEDDAIVVVDKPAGLLAVPLERQEGAPSVQDELVFYLRSQGKRRPLVVHRIDRDTSGLVLFAKRADAQRHLKEQFKRREPERVYLAVVYGVPSPEAGVWRDRLVWDQRVLVQKETHPNDPRGQEAACKYKVLEVFGGASLVEVRLITGRRNQIRLQARLHGHTLIGEARYTYGPETLRPVEFPRQALHAHRLGFRHPVTGRGMSLESPLPTDMKELVETLRTGNLFPPRRSLSN
jgi:23S rRNA pseudouridine1911/1915/1917 synthase